MLLPSIDGTTMTLPALRERYRDYALTIRNVCADTARERLRYLDGLFDYLGEPTPAGRENICSGGGVTRHTRLSPRVCCAHDRSGPFQGPG